MNTLKDTAYKENTDKGWLLENGYDLKFIEWLEDNHYESFNGFELWIQTTTRQMKFFRDLKQIYNERNGWNCAMQS